MNLQNQVALVTGASRGIGRAIAEELSRQGARVIGTATSEAGAASISDYLSGFGSHAGMGRVLNVNDAAACKALLDEIQKTHGSLSILVNNAGITQDQLALRMSDEEWDNVIATNLSSVGRLSRAVLRGMVKARYGRIVNVTSVVASSGNPGQMNYAAAKAGVEGMSRALASEVGTRNITVNCIAPGFIDTDMTRALNENQIKALTERIPMGRFGQPQDVAHACAFVASPQAAYITGVTLHVNGGMYMC